MNFQDFPNELWAHIFEFLESRRDRLQVLLSCRRFYNLGHRSLYHTLLWVDPQHTAQCLVYLENQLFNDVPHSLVVANHTGFAEHEANPEQTGSFHPFSVSIKLMGSRISNFSSLEELSFFNSTLPESVYHAIFDLPQLRRLSIEYCTIPALSLSPDFSTFSALPLVELTLRCFSTKPQRINLYPATISPFYLATATNLRILRISWTRQSARFFTHQDSSAPIDYYIPPGLSDVDIRMPYENQWPKPESIARTLFTDPLISFLSSNPSITCLRLSNHVPVMELPSTALPNLGFYSGPLVGLSAVLEGRPLDHIDITDPIRYHQPFTHVMQEIGKRRPQLQTLSFLLPQWEKEVLFVLLECLSQLIELRFKYVVQNPDEQFLLSMGHEFFHQFPNLRAVRIYKPILPREINSQFGRDLKNQDRDLYMLYDPDLGPGAGADEDVKDIMLTWRKPCPNLREVQFEHGHVWRKCHDGSGWVKEPMEAGNNRVTEGMEMKWGVQA